MGSNEPAGFPGGCCRSADRQDEIAPAHVLALQGQLLNAQVNQLSLGENCGTNGRSGRPPALKSRKPARVGGFGVSPAAGAA